MVIGLGIAPAEKPAVAMADVALVTAKVYKRLAVVLPFLIFHAHCGGMFFINVACMFDLNKNV